MHEFEQFEERNICGIPDHIDNISKNITDILVQSSFLTVPRRKKNFFKFWWNQELDALKLQSIATCRLWKESGKPRSGSVFVEYRSAKASCRLAISSHQQEVTAFYTNDLHESLVNKRGSSFWKCWKSKLETKKQTITYNPH